MRRSSVSCAIPSVVLGLSDRVIHIIRSSMGSPAATMTTPEPPPFSRTNFRYFAPAAEHRHLAEPI